MFLRVPGGHPACQHGCPGQHHHGHGGGQRQLRQYEEADQTGTYFAAHFFDVQVKNR